MIKGVVQISISNDNSDYLLSIEDEDGETSEFSMSFEQLDLLSEAIDEHLNAETDETMLLAEDSETET